MITEEELSQLLREKATIYHAEWGKEIKELKLNEDFGFGYVDIDWDVTRCFKQQLYTYFDEDGDECEHNEYYLFEDLHRTREDAEWVAYMHARQMIVFAPPTWEEFNNNKYNKKFVFIDKKLQPHRLWVDIEEDETCNLYNKECIYIDTDIKALASKENYRKVVEYARKMFLGEVEND